MHRIAAFVDTALDRTVRARLHPDRARGAPAAADLAGRPASRARWPARVAVGHRRELGPRDRHRRGARRARCRGGAGGPRHRQGRAASRDEILGRHARSPGSTYGAATCPTSTTYAASSRSSTLEHVDVLVHNAGAMPPSRTESPQGHEMTMALHVLGPVLMTDLLAAAAARRPGGLRDLRWDVRPAAARRRPGVPASATTRRPPPTPAASAPRSSCCRSSQRAVGHEASSVHATHPGWADTPGVTESLPTFNKVTRPAAARRRVRRRHDRVARRDRAGAARRRALARPAAAADPAAPQDPHRRRRAGPDRGRGSLSLESREASGDRGSR